MTTVESITYSSLPDDIDYDFTEQELERIQIEYEKFVSKSECKDKSINISLIAFNELERIGFKRDLSTCFLSKLVEEIYHERKAYSSSDYFDLTKMDNEHYKELADYYKIGNEQFYIGMVAKAIGSSKCECKNINELVYGVASNVSNIINQNVKKFA